MRKFFSDLIASGFIALMILALLKGIGVLLGFESPENIEGGGHHAFTDYAYGNWGATLLSIGIFSFFVLSFLTPLKKQNWRTLGLYEAFIIALFTEMYGFPLRYIPYLRYSGYSCPLAIHRDICWEYSWQAWQEQV